jgi:hypothetical protein
MKYDDLKPGKFYKHTHIRCVWLCGNTDDNTVLLTALSDGSAAYGRQDFYNTFGDAEYLHECDIHGGPIKVEPAAGQVWQDSEGDEYVIRAVRDRHGNCKYILLWDSEVILANDLEDATCFDGCISTYVRG